MNKKSIELMLQSEYQINRLKKKQQQIDEYYKNPKYCKCGCGEMLHPITDRGFRVLSYTQNCKQVSSNKGKKLSKETKKRISESKKGKKTWNKGLTKENNKSLQSTSEKMTGKNNPAKRKDVIAKIKETKIKNGTNISGPRKAMETMIKNGTLRSGKCKWYQYNGQKVQGKFELKFAKFLDSIELGWTSHKGIETFQYIGLDGIEHSYFPDFLDENGVYYEPHSKYFWDEKFEHKISEVRRLNPDKTFIAFHEDNYLDTCKTIIESIK